MERNAFTGGVEPGGLWNKNDIRILLCYILQSVDGPLSRDALCQIIGEKALANFFEVGDAIDSLLKQGNLKEENGLLTVTDTGREIAQSLDATLPLSVRDKALEAALRLMAEARARRENRVEKKKTDRGYQVTFHISGGELDLMTISIYVPDRAQADLVERNFYHDPEQLYRLLLSSLTGDMTYIGSFLLHGGDHNSST